MKIYPFEMCYVTCAYPLMKPTDCVHKLKLVQISRLKAHANREPPHLMANSNRCRIDDGRMKDACESSSEPVFILLAELRRQKISSTTTKNLQFNLQNLKEDGTVAKVSIDLKSRS